MAGGKETPRQKMIGMMYLVLTAMLAMNVSNEIVNAFVTIDKGLEGNEKTIVGQTKKDVSSIKAKAENPEEALKAKWAIDAAIQVQNLTKSVIDDINSHRKGLLDLAQETEVTGDLSQIDLDKLKAKDNYDHPTNYFIEQKNGDKLKVRLEKYQTDLKGLLKTFKNDKGQQALRDDVIDDIAKSTGFNFGEVKAQDGTKKDWVNATFYHTPMVATYALISNLENGVRNAESQAISNVKNAIGAADIKFDKFVALASQNGSFFENGETMEAKIVLGAFSSSKNPIVTLGGRQLEVKDGVATYKTNVAGPGEMSGTVTMNEPGFEPQPFKLKWDVAGAASAVVSAEDTKVFYIGVDNHVKVAAQGIKGQPSVSMSGGSYNNGIVRVTTPGEATITVSGGGKTLTQDKFRVKRIPNPTPMVLGKSGGVIAKGAMGAGFVEAKTDPNFLFNVNFVVTGFKVGAQGKGGIYQEKIVSGYSLAPAASILPSAGGKVFIENIKVSGPDGERVLPGSLVFTMQ